MLEIKDIIKEVIIPWLSSSIIMLVDFIITLEVIIQYLKFRGII